MTNQKALAAVAPRNPGGERGGVVADAIDDKAVPLDAPVNDGVASERYKRVTLALIADKKKSFCGGV